ncbi:MAG: PD-(D/E)XK nuclease family protein [Treponema sp.]|jgi:CRISPR/Cas system-associated exonuclease Cas4 (RecB family)|nr:PD-(D/E)XK nuclease family protein [Treponema sp.]
MIPVFQIIAARITDPGSCFVFPSQVAALQWARKICVYGPLRSIAENRFLAWDRFKEIVLRVRSPGRRPVSSELRKLFALSLVRDNAVNPVLLSFIPPEFAADGAIFAKAVAALLPALAFWEAAASRSACAKDDEDRDLALIKSAYASFLEKHRLFEPSWETASADDIHASLQKEGKRCLVFFPEALSDFSEYRAMLDCPEIELIYSADSDQGTDAGTSRDPFERAGPDETTEKSFRFFHSSREEIKETAAELRRLHDGGIPYEDMAVSLPDFKNMESYLARELALYDVPYYSRAGKALGEYPAGRLFTLIGECVNALFSFDALKALLLDRAIPWRYPEKNSRLVNFGVLNHCVSSYRGREGMIDAWEEAFKKSGEAQSELGEYYRSLKQKMIGLGTAGGFGELRDRYFAFREFFNMDYCTVESDAVLARAVEELSLLVQLEKEYPDLKAANPFDFFCAHLGEKNYVPVRQAGGVNVYDYPVAAGAPFRCHFVLNASQNAAAVRYRPLPFLRDDKRARLGVKDSDVSAVMLSLYQVAPCKNFSCHTRISAAERTFSGWAIPHSSFALTEAAPEDGRTLPDSDPYKAEKLWRAGGPLPQTLFSIQKKGFAAWTGVLLDPAAKSGRQTNVAAAELKRRVRDRGRAGAEELSVSATDLTEFFTCPVSWLYKRVFGLEEYKLDAALLDDESRGLLYHDILRRLFGRIKERDRVFQKARLDEYAKWAEEFTGAALRASTALRSPLVYPLLSPLAASMTGRIRALLKTEARYFSLCEVSELEADYSFVRRGSGEGGSGIRLKGRIDRVSRSAEGPLIIDYKTGSPPSLAKCRAPARADLAGGKSLDFQIPMYIRLYEEASGERVERAFFFSINKHDLSAVVGKLAGKRSPVSRDEYQATMDVLEKSIDKFAGALETLDFTPDYIPKKICAGCPFKTICRSLYALNPRPDPYRRKKAVHDSPEENGDEADE